MASKLSSPSEFRFDVSAKPKKQVARFGGAIGYPLPEGVERKTPTKIPATYSFKVRRPAGEVLNPNTGEPTQAFGQEVYSIQGKLVRSLNEWYTYQALLQSGVPDYSIDYQVPWHGGKAFGGQVLDFVLSQGGASTVLRVMGKYWHPSTYGTALDVYTRSQMEGEGYQVYDIPDYDLTTTEDAVSTLARLRVT